MYLDAAIAIGISNRKVPFCKQVKYLCKNLNLAQFYISKVPNKFTISLKNISRIWYAEYLAKYLLETQIFRNVSSCNILKTSQN